MKVLVTGGAGFIGSHLCDRMIADGHKVIVIDNFSTGRLENLKHLAAHDSLEVHELDIVDHEAISEHFSGVDWVFHLAALADIVPSIQQPYAYHRSNVDGTMSVLEAAKKANVKRFIYAASSSCYGIPDQYPTPESAEPRPQYPYALTKFIGEQYVLHWAQVYGMPAVSLRFFNVYGPRSRTSGTYGAVFGVFLAQKLAGEPFTIVGDGDQTRDFTYVTDVVNALTMAAGSDITETMMNVGSDNTYSVNKLVSLLGGDVVHIPKRPGEPDCTYADISRIQEMLGWVPQVAFEDGVEQMLTNIDYWREAPVWTPDTIASSTADWFRYLGREQNN